MENAEDSRKPVKDFQDLEKYLTFGLITGGV